MTATQSPKEFRMDGLVIDGEIYVRESDCRAGMNLAISLNGNSELLGALLSIISHWDEFGAERGFNETIERARKIVKVR